MKILIIDDDKSLCELISIILKKAGYSSLRFANSVSEGLKLFDGRESGETPFVPDLILMDILMPGINGIEGCRMIKAIDAYSDIPIIVITAMDKVSYLEPAFSAGAIDYITKPFHNIELIARVRSILKLKLEMDNRKAREMELVGVNRELEESVDALRRLALLDGLTKIFNRHYFNEAIEKEWNRTRRSKLPISVILIDIDYFKLYNDAYGHQAGDDCLVKVAQIIKNCVKRSGDFTARYGGEEFAVVLPNTNLGDAMQIAENIRKNVEKEKLKHENSKAAKVVTLSLGVSATIPKENADYKSLVESSDRALYKAKKSGRNRVEAV